MGRCGVVPVLVLLVYPVAPYLPHNDCGDPPPIANSYRTFPDNSTVEYWCMDTYFLSSGDLVRDCINGTYTGTSPVCTLDCGPPLNTSYASINSTGTKAGDTVTYTCPNGFLVSSTDTECSGSSGYWLAGDRCFANVSLDVTPFTATQTSTANLTDILNTVILSSLSPNSTFDAPNAVDQTNLALNLLTGGCSSTKLEQRPSMTVTLGDYYTIYQVAVTLPNDDFAFSIPNLIVRSASSHSHLGSLCMKHKDTIPAGSRFVAVCSGNRYPVPGKILRFEVDFGNNPGMLQICQIEVYGRPVISVDCGQPPAVPFAVITTPPSSTFYKLADEAVTYECIEGYTMKSGKGTGYCNSRGNWVVSITCTGQR
ncbi:uncharacterized protein LOC124290803 [Haliotis rubra]|uniref:uncharacterized protein LOC124290803 n=1 Tax=Haliotis rubra TaxID=36100 RepID=UPI001EE60355|nr:uncharacterized protein LOC124290803 [Haliotis rubra]